MPSCEIPSLLHPPPSQPGKFTTEDTESTEADRISLNPPPVPARMHEALPRNPGSVASLDLQPIATPSGSRSPQNHSLESRGLNAIGRGMRINSNVESLDATPLPLPGKTNSPKRVRIPTGFRP